MIQINNLTKSFGRQQVLNGLNLALNPGKIYAILGPNGSGKTTLIKSILGMVIPQEGELEVLGKPIKNKSQYRKHLNYLPQIANFPANLTVNELFKMIKDLRGVQADETTYVKLFELEPFLNKRLAYLSGGTKQKVNICIAFMFNEPLYILDEPTSGLDPISVIRLKKLIKEHQQKGDTFLITSHILQFVEEIADEIVYLLEGKIYFKGSLLELYQFSGKDSMESAIALISQTNPKNV